MMGRHWRDEPRPAFVRNNRCGPPEPRADEQNELGFGDRFDIVGRVGEGSFSAQGEDMNMAARTTRRRSKIVQLTALGFSLTIGAAAASAAVGDQATNAGDRLARLSQARAAGTLDIQYNGDKALTQASKPRRSLEMQTAQFASYWTNSWRNSL
jgi:hypothetical protein